jgi:hypothetical protein
VTFRNLAVLAALVVAFSWCLIASTKPPVSESGYASLPGIGSKYGGVDPGQELWLPM